tara:strand:+ start:69 stop:638 length:570 start_codon:yes stop_codon:yes gene_type:complete
MRKGKADRVLHPGASTHDIVCDYACGPFDEAARRMDRKWGIDRLPELVTPEMAAKFGKAIAALNASIDANDPEAVQQNAQNCIKGFAAMDAAAEASGAPKADPSVWEYDHDGMKFAVIRDDRAWPALKAARPDLLFFTMREVANALKAYNLTGENVVAIKTHFPGAQITKVENAKLPVNWDLGGDEIPY